MVMQLNAEETRVIGCLIEKEITTPEQYPLSLNALTNACNQKSNRDPVVEYSEGAVERIAQQLTAKHLVTEEPGGGGRVRKFRHRFCNTSFGTLKFSPQELAVICELFLRGPQTPGELRSRASRLCPFGDFSQVEAVLSALAQREDGPFVVRLARVPGKRESRYAHTFTPVRKEEIARRETIAAEPPTAEHSAEELERRVAALEAEVAELQEAIDELRRPRAAE